MNAYREVSKTAMALTAAGMLLAVATVFTGCGKQEFKKLEFQSSASSKSGRKVPPKVDIVIVADNSGSMNTPLATVETQFAGFVSSIQSKFWDYRIAKTHVINPSPISRVLVNPDFQSATLPDGTPNPHAGQVLFSNQIWTSSSQFLPLVSAIDSTGAPDNTYPNTVNAISAASPICPPYSTYMTRSSSCQPLLRRDATMAVVVVTNGAEYNVDPGHNGVLNNALLTTYSNQLKALRTDPSLVRFYSVASNSAYSSGMCLGGSAYIGTSYSAMISQSLLSGSIFNVCNMGSISSVLANIEADLQVTMEKYVTTNIVLTEEPIPSTIHVFKNGVEMSQSGTNGWQYIGGPSTAYTITGILQANGSVLPFNADQQTGWVVQLNGSGRLIGTDTYEVVYQKP